MMENDEKLTGKFWGSVLGGPTKTYSRKISKFHNIQIRCTLSGEHCSAEDRETVHNLLSAIGYCTEVKEELVDTVTGFAGTGLLV